MKSFKLEGALREEVGKKSTKKIRKEGKVPCVLYGGEKNIHFESSVKNFRHLIYTPNVYLVDIKVNDKNHKAIMQDIQFHPVSDDILHIDFLEISEDKNVTIDIPVILEGLAVGVKEGGNLYLLNRRLKIKGLAKDLPDTLNINVENLELGKSIKVLDLKFDNLEILTPKNSVVASVKLTRVAKGMAATEDEEAEEPTTDTTTTTEQEDK